MHEVISIAADIAGCSLYRMTMPNMLCRSNDLVIIDSQKAICHPEFYKTVRLVRVQRMVTPEACKFVTQFLKPLSQQYGFWLAYDIDDVIGANDVPKYNKCWKAYQSLEYQQSIKQTMQTCDYVTVTTQNLKDYVIKQYDLQANDVQIIPNYLAKWWIDGLYNHTMIHYRFNEMESRKPRICFPLSSSHYDVVNNNNGIDDITHILPWITDNVDKYDFTFVGGLPQQLKQLVIDKKIKFCSGFELFNYPKELSRLDQDLYVAPLQDNTFNRCKSPIKVLESAALGVPCLCQNLPTYKPYTDLLWHNSCDLDNLVTTMLSDKGRYMSSVFRMNERLKNEWWIENHLNDWMELYNLPQRTLSLKLEKRKTFQIQPKSSLQVTG